MKEIAIEDASEQIRMLVDELDDEGVILTRDGEIVATLLKFKGKSAHLIGSMKDKIEIHGDIFSTGRRWEASDWEPDGQS